jgi:hypothetical protein
LEPILDLGLVKSIRRSRIVGPCARISHSAARTILGSCPAVVYAERDGSGKRGAIGELEKPVFPGWRPKLQLCNVSH